MIGEPTARLGAIGMAVALAFPCTLGSGHLVPTADGRSDAVVPLPDVRVVTVDRSRDRQLSLDAAMLKPEAVAGAASTPVAEPTPTQGVAPTPEPTPRPTSRANPPTAFVLPSLAPPATSGVVIASWYGPGFYGNRTACGQTYTPEIVGVAHRTLPCGTLVTLVYRGRTVTVPVIDRGPYVAGRTLDLSNATHLALACPDLCTLSMRLGA